MPKASSNYIKDKLETSLKTVGDMALKRRARNVIEGLDLQDGDRILEVGCGNGYYLSLLNRLGLNIDLVGIDNDQLALTDAAKFIGDKGVKLILADASKIPFPANSFDKVVMSEVIEHVNDEQAVLKEVFRILKRNGILALTTCNIDYPFFWDPINWILQHIFNTHIRSGFWAGIWNQHTRLYKKDYIDRLIKRSGFEVLDIESLTSWCLPFNHYLVNMIAKLFYSHKLPGPILAGMNKFKNNKQPIIINFGFRLINLFDKLNDLIPGSSGVSIFVKGRKI
jgi:ubiquinone/menaquinone biosynthesis C-methylase UbiE